METLLVPKHSTAKMCSAFEKERARVEQRLADGAMIFETVLDFALDAAMKAGAEEIAVKKLNPIFGQEK